MTAIAYLPAYVGLWASLTLAALAAFRVNPLGPSLLPALVFWGALFGIGLASGRAHGKSGARWPVHLSHLLMVISLLVTVAALASDNLETMFVVFLLSMQVARNFTLHARRDFYFALVISFIVFFDGINSRGQDGLFIYVVAYLLATLFTFTSDYVDSRMAVARGGDRDALARRFFFPFALFSTAITVLILATGIFLVTPRLSSPQAEMFPADGGWRDLNRQNSRASRKASGPGTPESGHGARGSRGTPSPADGGGTPSVSPYRGFQDEFDVEQPWDGREREAGSSEQTVVSWYSTHAVYLRARTFDQFDGQRWRESTIGDPATSSFAADSVGHEEGSAAGRQRIEIHQPLGKFMPTGQGAVGVEYGGWHIDPGDDGTFRSTTRLWSGAVYRVQLTVRYVDEDTHPIVSSGSNDLPGLRHFQLPEAADARVASLARQLTRGGSSDMSRAEAIERYLQSSFARTVQVRETKRGIDPVATFLFDGRQAHNEVFATSMVLLLRAVHIPARLVTGFANPKCDPFTNQCEATFLDAHAWVEAYVDGKGWVSFEPTPGYEVASAASAHTALGTLIEQLRHKVRYDQLARMTDWTTTVSDWIVRLWDGARDLWRKLLRVLGKMIHIVWKALKSHGLLFGAAVLSLAAIGYVARRVIRSYMLALLVEKFRLWRARRRGPSAVVFANYAAMERLLARLGWARHASWTPREYERHLYAQVPRLEGPVALLTGVFSLARYGATAVDQGQAELATRAFETLSRAIREMRVIER